MAEANQPSDGASPGDVERLRQEVGYYKQQLDALAGENLKLDYSISGLRHELKQKRQGFALLSGLQQSIGAEKQVANVFEKSLGAINSTLGMDKTVIFEPTPGTSVYRPTHAIGFTDAAAKALTEQTTTFPSEFVLEGGLLIVNKASAENELIAQVRALLELPYFVCLPVMVDGAPIAVLVSGRTREAKPLYPPLDRGDADTFLAIAGLISTIVKNMKIAVLEELDRVKTEFFANISHEFRTPITLTLGPLDALLKDRYGVLPQSARDQLEMMQRNQQRLLTLINQILDLSKLEAGRMKLAASRVVDMNRFVDERVALFRPTAERRGLELRTEFSPEVASAELYIDRQAFDKVLFNLLSNANKFTQSGFIAVSTEVVEKTFRLSVRDSGIGIREDQLPFMFERFQQAAGSASREYAGTGIGLSLVKEVAKLHGGDATVQSQYGHGTTFQISIPLGKDHLAPEAIVAAADDEVGPSLLKTVAPRAGDAERRDLGDAELFNAQALSNFDRARPTILYTDDNPDLRAFVRDVLATRYNVFLAIDGVDGLEKARAHRPDLILSDLMMPNLTGTEFCQKIREDPDLRGTPFVLLTAQSALESKIEGLEEGADDYLSKPFVEAELLARIKNLVRLRANQLRLKRELDAARKIQLAMLPPRAQQFGSLRADALYQPSEELSGDFFDTIALGDWLYFYVADVTSHGTAAAQVTYAVKGLFRQLLAAGQPPPLETLLPALREGYRAFNLDFDVSFQAARVNLSSHLLEYACGGAPEAMLVRGGKGLVLATAQGPSLSRTAAASHFAVNQMQLEPADRLFVFTDGCYEFKAGEREFGRRQLLRLLSALSDEHWATEVLDGLAKAGGSRFFDDDITLFRLSVAPG